MHRLQSIQNGAARAVCSISKFEHITPVLKNLHWLKVNQRIKYKIISLTYSALQFGQPQYLRHLLTISKLVQPALHQQLLLFVLAPQEQKLKIDHSAILLLFSGTNFPQSCADLPLLLSLQVPLVTRLFLNSHVLNFCPNLKLTYLLCHILHSILQCFQLSLPFQPLNVLMVVF